MSKKIKSIKRYNQNYKNFSFSDLENTIEEEFMELEVILDDKGNVVEEIKFSPDGSLEEKNSYSFNDAGKLLEHTLLYAVDDVTEKRKFTRNDKGFLVSEIKYYGDDSGEGSFYEYDSMDNVTSIVHKDEEGIFLSKEEMKYDDKGSLIERINYDSDQKLIGKTRLSIPEPNHIEELELDANDNLVSKTIVVLNDKGKEISSVQTNPQGKIISRITNVFDERGNVIEKIHKDFYSKKVLYAYNEKDLLISQELFDDHGLLLRKNMYEYDDDGNVIAEQTYEMDTTRGGRDKHFAIRYEYSFY